MTEEIIESIKEKGTILFTNFGGEAVVFSSGALFASGRNSEAIATGVIRLRV